MELVKIQDQLDRIERGLLAQKKVLNFEEYCTYVGISKSHGYKQTSQRKVPHFCPNGKTLFFDIDEVNKSLLQNPIKTTEALKAEALKSIRVK